MEVSMSVGIQPLGDYVVAEQEVASNKTASGLYIPDAAKEKPQIAKVLAVGPGKIGDDNERVPLEVKVGDRIIYGGYSNTEVKHDGKDYMLIKEENIYAIVK
jgi:chaperonin GroES